MSACVIIRDVPERDFTGYRTLPDNEYLVSGRIPDARCRLLYA